MSDFKENPASNTPNEDATRAKGYEIPTYGKLRPEMAPSYSYGGMREFNKDVREQQVAKGSEFDSTPGIQGVRMLAMGYIKPTEIDIDDKKPATLHAYVYSKNDGIYSELLGLSTGRVILKIGNEENDITNAAAKAGITAEGIRLLQQNVASDGTVSEAEQKQIANIIQKATALIK